MAVAFAEAGPIAAPAGSAGPRRGPLKRPPGDACSFCPVAHEAAGGFSSALAAARAAAACTGAVAAGGRRLRRRRRRRAAAAARRAGDVEAQPPWWWDGFWKLAPELGPDGSPVGTPELLRGVKAQIEEQYFGQAPAEGIPQVRGLAGRTGDGLFQRLRSNFDENGPVTKASLGPAGIVTVADPTMVRHIFEGRGRYDKGPLAVVSEDIFGKGLITAADRGTWEGRRKVVGQGFHNKWIRGLVEQFSACTSAAFEVLDAQVRYNEPVDMESVYLNLTLDIVGLAVFGVEFRAIEQPPDEPQSPIVRAVYRVLKETGYRADDPRNLLLAQVPDAFSPLFPTVTDFRGSLRKLDDVLDQAIAEAQQNKADLDAESLQLRSGGSLLRFLVDLRGEDVASEQLRDDLRTLLIAGHETVASILTWATFELALNPDVLATALQEIDEVLQGRVPTYDDVRELKYLRLVVVEALRLYPAPPSLFRRALAPDTLPRGTAAAEVPLGRGTLITIQTAMLHRNPHVYAEPDRFWPERWLEPFGGEDAVPGWKGYDPSRVTGLYPNEIATDYAFVPFAGGEYKCIGDQFAMLEATVVLAMMLQRYSFEPLQKSLDEVGLDLAATIHTKRGLRMRVRERGA